MQSTQVKNRRIIALFMVLFAALGLSACGGGSASPSVASAGSNQTTTTVPALTDGSTPSGTTAKALKFVQCMRSHGVTNYPDPHSAGRIPSVPAQAGDSYLGDSFNPNTPTFQAGERACQKFAVGLATKVTSAGAAEVEAEQLKYAQCMRSHGISNFPDPGASGGFTIPNSVGQNSSFFQAGERACKNFLPGRTGPPGS